MKLDKASENQIHNICFVIRSNKKDLMNLGVRNIAIIPDISENCLEAVVTLGLNNNYFNLIEVSQFLSEKIEIPIKTTLWSSIKKDTTLIKNLLFIF